MLRILSQCVFCLIVAANALQGQDFSKLYKAGGTLYVCAADGLILNDKAGLNGVKVKLVSYGSPVLVQKDSQPQVEIGRASCRERV